MWGYRKVLLFLPVICAASKEDVEREERIFRQTGQTVGLKLFTSPENFASHTSKLFEHITAQGMRDLARIFAANPPEFGRHLRHTDWEAICKSDSWVCTEAGRLAANSPESSLKSLTWPCIAALNMSGNMDWKLVPLARLRGIGKGAIKEGGSYLVEWISNLGAWTHLSTDQLDTIFSNDEACQALQVNDLRQMRKNQRGKMTGKCFALMTDTDHQGLDPPMIGDFSQTLFDCITHNLHSSWYQGMTKGQLEHFGKACPEEENCLQYLRMDLLKAELKGKVSPKVFAGALSGWRRTTESGSMADFSKFSETIFSEIKDCTILEALDEETWRYASQGQLENLAKICPAACALLSTNGSFFVPTCSCFASMPAPVQIWHLQNKKVPLPNTLLINTCVPAVEMYEINGYIGIEALSQLDLPGALLWGLGMGCDEGSHPGSLVADVALWRRLHKKMKDVGPYFIRAMPIGNQLGLADLDGLLLDSLIFLDHDRLVSLIPDYFKKITSMSFSVLLERKDCERFKYEHFNQISFEAYQSLSGNCLLGLPFKHRLTSVQINLLPAANFALVDKDAASEFNDLLDLTHQQLAILSSAISPTQQHAALLFTADMISRLGDLHVQGISDRFMENLPSTSYAGFTPISFPLIQPTSLVKVTYDQISNVSEEALIQMTPMQVEHLGSKITDPKLSPRQIFTEELVRKMKPESRRAAEPFVVRSLAARLVPSLGCIALSLLAMAFLLMAPF